MLILRMVHGGFVPGAVQFYVGGVLAGEAWPMISPKWPSAMLS